jgi:RHS repeat-associated protein
MKGKGGQVDNALYVVHRIYMSHGDGEWTYLNISTDSGPGLTTVEDCVESNCVLGRVNKNPVVLGDFNGDGMTDIGRVGSLEGDIEAAVFYASRGDGTFAHIETNTDFPTDVELDDLVSQNPIVTGDFDGDGKTDIGRVVDGVDFYFRTFEAPDLIKKVTTPLGATTTVTYKPSSAWQNDYLPFKLQTVATITTTDNGGHSAIVTYAYEDGKYEPISREFRGFEKVTATESATGLKTETCYHQDKVLQSRVDWSKTTDSAGELVVETDNTWKAYVLDLDNIVTNISEANIDLIPSSYSDYRRYAYLRQSVVTKYNENGSSLATITTYYNYDEFGNLLSEDKLTSDGIRRFTRTEYYNRTIDWILGKPYRIRIAEADPNNSCVEVLHETRMTYYYPDRPWLLHEKKLIHDGAEYAVTTYDYDQYGNVTSETDPRNPSWVTTIDYSDSNGMFPNETTNALGHKIYRTFDPKFGVVLTETGPHLTTPDPNQTTVYSYDGFGRKGKKIGDPADVHAIEYPDGSYKDYTYNIAPGNHYVTATATDSPTETVYYDNFGRKIREELYDGTDTIVKKTEYDNAGRVTKESLPYFSGTAVGDIDWTVNEYHTTRGYLKKQINPDGTYREIVQNGFQEIITDENGHSRTITKDSLGRLKEVQEPTTGITEYAYDLFDNMTYVKDPVGNETFIYYDDLGRKKNMDDPDMGFWQYTYDANGNLETQTDAKGQVKTFYYDELNRLVEENYTSEYPTVYAYDQGSNGIGQLYKVTKENIAPQIDTFTRYDEYDAMGRVKEFTKWVNGAGEYTTEYNYDMSGKTTKIIYPDDYEVDYEYYPGTNLLYTATGSDSEVYAEITDYTPTGQIGTLEHGNGAETTYSYDSKSTRLTGITTMDATPGLIQNKAYQYTPAGDIDSIVDYHNDSTFDYTYDNLHRLMEEKTNSVISATYTYNNIGNITSKSMGSDDFNYTSYHANHKHAVETISLNGTPYDYTYDDNGNMLSGPDFTNTSQVGTRSIEYNTDNMPTQVTSVRGDTSTTVNYGYDGFGQRVKKEVVGGMITYYIGDHFEKKGETLVKYIFVGNLRVAKVEGSTLTYLHKDHLGSSTVITSYTGYELESTQFNPYGSTRLGSGEITDTPYQFTDQELDSENGLYNYNARLYDPFIGRFISPDTIVPEPYNPQSLNRYSYCLNNPLIYVDPSGHEEEMPPYYEFRAYLDMLWHYWKTCEIYGGSMPESLGFSTGFETALIMSGLDLWNLGFEEYNQLVYYGEMMDARKAGGGGGGTSAKQKAKQGAPETVDEAPVETDTPAEAPKKGRDPTPEEREELEEVFPGLEGTPWTITEEATDDYNCISLTVDVKDRPIYPQSTMEAQDSFYAKKGFVFTSEEHATIAVFAKNGVPQHGAVRVQGNWYESKLGEGPQIVHPLRAVEGEIYGKVTRFYAK